ncbi:MAG: stage II sporulation protein M [Bacteroidota bacterium]
MRETSFIKQNKEKWQEFEQILAQKNKDPDQLNELFIQITDDLSYSRTFYPNRSVRVYLNNLAQQIFYRIYRNKKTKLGRLFSFWTDELPQLVYESRTAFRTSLLIFLSALAIGALSSAMDPEFPRVILGDQYVDMTLANIESGDPMAVYKEKGQFGMSLGITANNLFVAFLTFVLGALFAVGSAAILLQNGIMVGAFQYFFYEQGIFWESFLTIWTHGTLEISAIIIAGAAGLTMGRGLVFPGTLTRLQAFQISARRGLKIMLGITPIFVLAGFIEGYLTRYTETPDIVRLLFILICLLFILFYFLWYPWYKARLGFTKHIQDTELPPSRLLPIDFQSIKSSGEIFADAFIFIKKQFVWISGSALGLAGAYCLLLALLSQEGPLELFVYPSNLFGAIQTINQYFIHESLAWLQRANKRQ